METSTQEIIASRFGTLCGLTHHLHKYQFSEFSYCFPTFLHTTRSAVALFPSSFYRRVFKNTIMEYYNILKMPKKEHSYTFEKVVDNFLFKAPSKRAWKKYDAFDENDEYITSFGDNRYQQFYDRIGYYSHLNHLDTFRQAKYFKRHGWEWSDIKPRSPKFFSHYFLWANP